MMAGIPNSGAAGSHLPRLGVFGFDTYEPVILASLVTEDPLLLIGRSGTGKTYLLNSLSEALGLQHRHYNASLISFDDLVGFPYPDAENGGVKFLETPATVWGAESVLVDEISRCKPEHQNRLFSLVHERRVQGIRLERLRFRWAAMNPCSSDQDAESYAGSEPLDPALADRFALIVPAADWAELEKADQRRIADPSGEGRLADDGGRLRAQLPQWRAAFEVRVESCPAEIVDYATAAVTTFNANALRISPRRARFLTRSLLAAEIVAGRSESLYETVLACTVPQQAWGAKVDPMTVKLTHRTAWDASMSSPQRKWIQRFHLEPSLATKLQILLDSSPDPDTGTQAVCELLAREPKERAAAFAFVIYPAAAKGLHAVGREGVNDLGKTALPILSVDGEVQWQERTCDRDSAHPEIARYARVISRVKGARSARAKQFFNWCVVEKVAVADPASLERDIEACVAVLRRRLEAA